MMARHVAGGAAIAVEQATVIHPPGPYVGVGRTDSVYFGSWFGPIVPAIVIGEMRTSQSRITRNYVDVFLRMYVGFNDRLLL